MQVREEGRTVEDVTLRPHLHGGAVWPYDPRLFDLVEDPGRSHRTEFFESLPADAASADLMVSVILSAAETFYDRDLNIIFQREEERGGHARRAATDYEKLLHL